MDSDGRQWLLKIFVYVALIVIIGYSVAVETALSDLSFSKNKIQTEVGKKAKRLSKLLEKPSVLLSAFTMNRVLLTIVLALYGYICSMQVIRESYENLSLWASLVAVLVVTVVTTIIINTFGVDLPKKIVGSNGENFAVSNTGYIHFVYYVLAPVRAISYVISAVISKVLGVSQNNPRGVITEEEIMMMVNASNENGGIEESQKEMISNIFDFTDLEISDVMTHRTEVVAVEINTNISEVINIAISSGKSRIPVFEEDIDSIVGIVNVKDLLKLIGKEKIDSFLIKDFLREVFYIPETMALDEAFKKLTSSKQQLAVVVDEYGGTAGIVTLEDILEEIVGNIQDEYDYEVEDIVKIAEGVYTIEGSASPEEIFEVLKVPMPSEHEYETMSGFIMDLLGRVPAGEEKPSVVYRGITFTVLKTNDKRIEKIKATMPMEDNENNI